MTQLEAMALSIAIEVPVATGIAAAGGFVRGRDGWLRLAVVGVAATLITHPGRDGWLRLAVVGVAATLITHPLAWGAAHALPGDWWLRLAVVEVAVALVESFVYGVGAGLSPSRALTLGVGSNLVSAMIGVWIG
jgi:hypothetical protein